MAENNPYIGPRPFLRGSKLYGRDRETRELADLLISQRIVLFFSPSGAGKSSLIEAALLPVMEEEGFQALGVVWVSKQTQQESLSDETNPYILSVLLSLESLLPRSAQFALNDLVRMDLADYLERRTGEDSADRFPEDILPTDRFPLIIFDQFEEIVTLNPEEKEQKQAFFKSVGKALRDRGLWALFSMREDFLAEVLPYRSSIPTRFRSVYRMDLLGRRNALKAIEQPAKSAGKTFAAGVAQTLVDNLARIKRGENEFIDGEYVEPVQLQVVCLQLWSGLDDGAPQISGADLEKLGDVNAALADYYADQVAEVAQRFNLREGDVRYWFGDRLITAQGFRGQVPRGDAETDGLPNEAVHALVDAYLVRGEKSRGTTWYQLTHDRMVDPIRENNEYWEDAHLNLLQRRARQWERNDRHKSYTLRGQEFLSIETWAEEHLEQMSSFEKAFYLCCKEAFLAEQRKRRNRRLLLTGLTLGLLITSALGAISWFARQDAIKQKRLADDALLAAEEARKVALKAKAQADLERDHAKRNEARALAEEARAVDAETRARKEENKALDAKAEAEANERMARTAEQQAQAEKRQAEIARRDAEKARAEAEAARQAVEASLQREKLAKLEELRARMRAEARRLALATLRLPERAGEARLWLTHHAYTVHRAFCGEANDATLMEALFHARQDMMGSELLVDGSQKIGANHLQITPAGHLLTGGFDGHIHLFRRGKNGDVGKGKVLGRVEGFYGVLSLGASEKRWAAGTLGGLLTGNFGDDMTWVATPGETITAISVQGDEALLGFQSGRIARYVRGSLVSVAQADGAVRDLAVIPSGDQPTMVAGTANGMYWWGKTTGRMDTDTEITALTAANGRIAWSTSQGLHLYEGPLGEGTQALRTAHRSRVTDLHLDAQGRIISSSTDGSVLLWFWAQEEPVPIYKRQNIDPIFVWAAAFAPQEDRAYFVDASGIHYHDLHVDDEELPLPEDGAARDLIEKMRIELPPEFKTMPPCEEGATP